MAIPSDWLVRARPYAQARNIRRVARWLAPLLVLLLGVAELLPPANQAPIARAAGPAFVVAGLGGADQTRSVALGDLNGDGALDIVKGEYGQSIVFLKDSAGHFGAGTPFGGANNTRSMALGDLNGDGALDIVQGNGFIQGTTGVPGQVYLNDGAGHFGAGVPFGGVNNTNSIALGDLNGDGKLDIVQGNQDQPSLVYLNDGAGHFATSTPFGGVSNTNSIVLGDLNGDGALDLVQDTGGRSQIYLNDGAGHFTTSTPFGDVTDSGSFALGDLNGDGKLDIVHATYTAPSVIYLNDGQGHFLTGTPFGKTGGNVTLGDLNGDGALDIVQGLFDTVYLNDGAGQFATGTSLSDSAETASMAVGDLNGDGALDIVAGNAGQQSQIFINSGAGGFGAGTPISTNQPGLRVALGDLNGDGALDAVEGFFGAQTLILLNDGHGRLGAGAPLDNGSNTTSLALGDLNGDGALDIVQSKGYQPSAIYLNDGAGKFSASPFGTAMNADNIALGDLNGDGALDIIQAITGQRAMIALNDGAGHFNTASPLSDATNTDEVVLGDLNGDGALDLVARNNGPSQIYLNDGQGHFTLGSSFGGTFSLGMALGDLNGDGALDIVQGNDGLQSMVYLNDGAGHFGVGSPFGGAAFTIDVALGDLNGDGALDLVQGNNGQSQIYLNDGQGHFVVSSPFGPTSYTTSVALGDLNGDGALDIVQSNFNTPNQAYLNQQARAGRLPNNPPTVAVTRPGRTANANFYSTPDILGSPTIAIPYRLADAEGDLVRVISATFSLDGGANWRPAIAAAGTPTHNLPASPSGTAYSFVWNTFASGVFGRSDNVVFRIQAYEGSSGARSAAGSYQRPYASAISFPFRVRGSQVRVLRADMPTTAPSTLTHKIFLPLITIQAPGALPTLPLASDGALVYRIRPGQVGTPLVNAAGQPFRTGADGYLLGRSAIQPGDQLVALQPIAATSAYTIYLTNAAPTPTGLDAYTIQSSGVQTLTVTRANPLILFNLSVSLEWDARNDTTFLSQLRSDLQRTSELLYDWTNGQAALGTITVYHAKAHWQDANIRLNASNRLRPSANQGGIAEPLNQVRIGAVWNRFGDPSGNQGEDWPRALAHELGHYAFSLDDDYLGLDGAGRLISVSKCPGAMSDPYRDDQSEFRPRADWLPDCVETLANRTTGQSDWDTIVGIYPWMHAPTVPFKQVNPGPSRLPLALTQVQFVAPGGAGPNLATPVFNLTSAADGGRLQPGDRARAFLFKQHGGSPTDLIDLGRPALDQVPARGAEVGDRLCVYDLEKSQLGCKDLATGDTQLALGTRLDWHPQLIVTPVTSRTLTLAVPAAGVGAPAPATLLARVFPSDIAGAPSSATLTLQNGQYQGSVTLGTTSLEGYVQVLVPNDPAPGRDIVTDYALGGNPAPPRRPPRRTRRRAPAMSTDGQVILYGQNLDFANGEFYAIQTATALPPPPSWATFVGQGYRLIASPGAPALQGVALNISYADGDVAPGTTNGVSLYRWDGAAWQLLSGQAGDVTGEVTAPVSQAGLYVLMSSAEIPLKAGINLVAYPIAGKRPVAEALASIAGAYTTVRSYDPVTGRWRIYTAGAPGYANTLTELEYGKGYEIRVTRDTTLLLRGEDTPTSAALARIAPPVAFPPAPAHYYGVLRAEAGFVPDAGQLVRALIAGQLCGEGRTQTVAGQTVYVLDVAADAAVAGCGAPGRRVTILVNGRVLARDVRWDNQQAREVNPGVRSAQGLGVGR